MVRSLSYNEHFLRQNSCCWCGPCLIHAAFGRSALSPQQPWGTAAKTAAEHKEHRSTQNAKENFTSPLLLLLLADYSFGVACWYTENRVA
jgi:hypothetical protein